MKKIYNIYKKTFRKNNLLTQITTHEYINNPSGNGIDYFIGKLAKKEQELQELEAKLTQDIMLENQKLNVQLADSLTNYLKEFNADGRYHVILSNTAKDNVLMAAEQYDITDEVVAGLNARCKK